MKFLNFIVIFIVCIFSLTGCLAASSKRVRFTCNNSVDASNFKREFSDIAQAHQFFPAPVPEEELELLFYSNLKSSPKLYVVISKSPTPEIVLGVSVIRGPGTEDKLPSEVLDVFHTIVREVDSRLVEKGCTFVQPEKFRGGSSHIPAISDSSY